MNLGSASKEEQDAAVAVVHRDIDQFIDVFMGTGLARMYRDQAKQKLDSPQGRQLVLKVVNDAYDAAEKVRASKNPPQQSPDNKQAS